MLTLLLNRWRESTIGVLIIVAFFFLQQWRTTTAELDKAKLVYEHPAVKIEERIVYRQGPVRIKTVIVKERDGSTIMTKEEDRAAVTADTNTGTESAPVPVSIALAPARTDRYLVSVGVNRLTPDFDGKAFLAGYGWRNRFDLQAGVIRKDDRTSPWLLATLRF